MLARRARRARRGMTIVESALVLSVFLMLLFGIFEYCRFLFVLHVAHNAAREGARYASVNEDKPSTFDATDYTDGAGTKYISVQQYTKNKLANVQQQIVGCAVAVYPVDSAGLALSPPVVRPKTTSTATPAVYPDPFNASDPNKTDWNLLSFPDRVAVTIKGTYKPVLPGFLFMPSSIPFSVTAMSGSEG